MPKKICYPMANNWIAHNKFSTLLIYTFKITLLFYQLIFANRVYTQANGFS